MQNFTLTVNEAPAITSANNTTFTVGTNGSFTVTKTGFPTPTFMQSGDAAERGHVQCAATGVLSGTPAAGTGGTLFASPSPRATASAAMRRRTSPSR